jgi:hypothetical protein
MTVCVTGTYLDVKSLAFPGPLFIAMGADLGDNAIWAVNDGDDGWTYQSSQWSHAATTGHFNKSFKVATSIVILEDGNGHVG